MFLLEKRRKENPLSGIVLGLELEFVYLHEITISSEKKITTKLFDKLYDDRTLKMIFDENIKSDLKRFFPEYSFEYVKKYDKIDYKPNTIFVTYEETSEEIEEKFIGNRKKVLIVNYGYELITPPFVGENGYELESKIRNFLKNFYSFIESNKNYRTTKLTGLHVNISFQEDKIDYFKKAVVSTMFDQSHLIGNDDLRITFAENSLKVLRKLDLDFFHDILLNPDIKKFDTIMKKISDILYKEKHVSIRPKKDYFEFRVLGGENYHKKIDEIMEKIEKFALLVKKPRKELEKKARELVKRIYEITVKKHEKKKKEKVLSILDFLVSNNEISNKIVSELEKHDLKNWINILKKYMKIYLKEKNKDMLKEIFIILKTLSLNNIIDEDHFLLKFFNINKNDRKK